MLLGYVTDSTTVNHITPLNEERHKRVTVFRRVRNSFNIVGVVGPVGLILG